MSLDYKDKIEEFKLFFSQEIKSSKIEHFLECSKDWNVHHDINFVKNWFLDKRSNCNMVVNEIALNECKDWRLDLSTGNYSHISGEFFRIHGVRIDTDQREVGKGGWDQPMLTQVGFDGGLLGILKQRFSGIPHYLIEAKMEPGNYDKVQLSPTLQATFSNLKRAHSGSKPKYSKFFEEPGGNNCQVIYNQWLSEDGGRLYLKRNKGMIVEVEENTITDIPENFIWLSMWQIKELLHENAWINPHIRGIISHL